MEPPSTQLPFNFYHSFGIFSSEKWFWKTSLASDKGRESYCTLLENRLLIFRKRLIAPRKLKSARYSFRKCIKRRTQLISRFFCPGVLSFQFWWCLLRFPVSMKFQYSLPKLKFGVLPRECAALINFLPIRHNINSILFSINLINPASNWRVNSLSVEVLGLFSLLFFKWKFVKDHQLALTFYMTYTSVLLICRQWFEILGFEEHGK